MTVVKGPKTSGLQQLERAKAQKEKRPQRQVSNALSAAPVAKKTKKKKSY